MNKLIVFNGILVVCNIALLAFCGYSLFQSGTKQPPENPSYDAGDKTTKEAASSTHAKIFSANDLVKNNTPMRCVSSTLDDPRATNGMRTEIYVSGNRARIDTTAKSGTETVFSRTIRIGEMQYFLPQEGEGSGSKINISAIAEKAPRELQAAQDFGFDTKREMDCSSWAPDEKVFALPESVSFVDATDKTIESLQNYSQIK